MLVFVYGTLTEEAQVDVLLDDWTFRGPATLEGLHRVEGEYPTLAPGGRFEGRLLRTDDVDRLDAYEGVGRGLYARVDVPLGCGGDGGLGGEGYGEEDAVAVYVGDPARLGASADWPGEGPFAERVRAYVAANAVFVREGSDRQD